MTVDNAPMALATVGHNHASVLPCSENGRGTYFTKRKREKKEEKNEKEKRKEKK